MFNKKLPKIYCRVYLDKESIDVAFYGLLAYKTIDNFLKLFEGKGEEIKQINANIFRIRLYNLGLVYHFLSNEKFIPVTESFFYRDMERRDQLNLDNK